MPREGFPSILDTFNGTWSSESEGTGMDVNVSSDLGGVYVQLIEDWDSVFTTDNGAKMYQPGLKQVKPDGTEVMKFYGQGQIRAIITGFIEEDRIIPIESTFKGYADGSWQATIKIADDTTVRSGVQDIGSADLQIIEYRGAYFLPTEDEDLYIRQ